MAYRALNEGEDHNRLIRALANRFASEGFYVKADHIGHPNGSPDQIILHIPDISATKDYHKIIAEVETEGSLGSDDTYNQWKEFSEIYGTEFHIMVPKDCLQYAQFQAQSWGICVGHWWYM